MNIPELGKPPGQWCEHCDPKSPRPCRVFGKPERPYSCGSFQCLWTQHYDWDEELRPNKSRVVFERIDDENVFGLVDSGMPSSWLKPAVKRKIAELVRAGNAVVIKTKGEKHFLLPKGRSKAQVTEAYKRFMAKWQPPATPQT
jgi:hypothetical protein